MRVQCRLNTKTDEKKAVENVITDAADLQTVQARQKASVVEREDRCKVISHL